MSATCDCTVNCGDDPWLSDGSNRAQPCQNMLARQEEQRRVEAKLAKVSQLRNIYKADDLFELMDVMHARIQAFERLL